MIFVIEHLVMGSASHRETYIFNAKCHQFNVYDTEEQEQVLVPGCLVYAYILVPGFSSSCDSSLFVF